MKTVKMSDNEFKVWEEFSAGRKAAAAKAAAELSERELEERLTGILKPSLLAVGRRQKLNKDLIAVLRGAAKTLDLRKKDSESDSTFTKKLIAAAEKAAKTLSIKPRANLRKAMGVKNAIMTILAPQMMESYKMCIEDALRWEGDLSMVSMFLSDAADHMKLGCCMYEGDLKGAQEASSMDTSSRDMIPNTVWDFLQGSYNN